MCRKKMYILTLLTFFLSGCLFSIENKPIEIESFKKAKLMGSEKSDWYEAMPFGGVTAVFPSVGVVFRKEDMSHEFAVKAFDSSVFPFVTVVIDEEDMSHEFTVRPYKTAAQDIRLNHIPVVIRGGTFSASYLRPMMDRKMSSEFYQGPYFGLGGSGSLCTPHGWSYIGGAIHSFFGYQGKIGFVDLGLEYYLFGRVLYGNGGINILERPMPMMRLGVKF